MTDLPIVDEVLIAPSALQDLLRAAYEAGCQAVHENHQPDPDPSFSEAAWDYVASLDASARGRSRMNRAEALDWLEAFCRAPQVRCLSPYCGRFNEIDPPSWWGGNCYHARQALKDNDHE